MAHRSSFMSGHSGAVSTWEHSYDPKEKLQDFPIAPVLHRGQTSNTQKAQKWYQRWIPSSTACRLLLLTVVLETIINLTIEVGGSPDPEKHAYK